MSDTNARPSIAPEADPAAEPTEEAKIAALVETLSKENADYKDRLLRTLAEMENLRRRTEREIADSRAYGISAFARDILAVADNMDRALGGLDKELRGKGEGGTKAPVRGGGDTQR